MTPPTFLFTSRKRLILDGFLISAFFIAVSLGTGCGGKNDAINKADKKDAINGVPVPSLVRPKTLLNRDLFTACRS